MGISKPLLRADSSPHLSGIFHENKFSPVKFSFQRKPNECFRVYAPRLLAVTVSWGWCICSLAESWAVGNGNSNEHSPLEIGDIDIKLALLTWDGCTWLVAFQLTRSHLQLGDDQSYHTHCSQWFKKRLLLLAASEKPTKVPCEVFTWLMVRKIARDKNKICFSPALCVCVATW